MDSRLPLFLCFVALAMGALGCDCTNDLGGAASPCAGDHPSSGCGQECGVGLDFCPSGLYCGSDGRCTADCAPGGSDECMSDYSCTSTGRCVPTRIGDGSTVCADVYLDSHLSTPNVTLLVDQSGSMNDAFGATSRWTALRDSLMRVPDGFVYDLQSHVRFGLALYTSRTGECPLMTTVLPPALDNYDAIQAVYGPAAPIGDTPTGDAIDSIVTPEGPDPSIDPRIIVLATDGSPDSCERPHSQDGQPEAIAAAQRAYAAGIRLYIISVGDGLAADHQQAMANAGIGRTSTDPPAPYWVANDDAGLREALRTIIRGELSCNVTLRGRIDPAQACSGTVLLNGTPLRCDDPNGWRAVDATHVELLGTACETVTNGDAATLEARFPCDVVVLI